MANPGSAFNAVIIMAVILFGFQNLSTETEITDLGAETCQSGRGPNLTQ